MKFVSESIEEAVLEKQIAEYAKETGKAFADGIDSEFNDGKLNEGDALLIIGTIFASPAIIKLIGIAIKKGSKLLAKFLKKHNTAGEVAGEGLKRFGDKMHHWLLKPVEAVLKKIGFTDKRAHQGAKIFHGVVVALLGIGSGLELADAIEGAKIGKGTLEGALTAIKSTETGVNMLQASQELGRDLSRLIGIIK